MAVLILSDDTNLRLNIRSFLRTVDESDLIDFSSTDWMRIDPKRYASHVDVIILDENLPEACLLAHFNSGLEGAHNAPLVLRLSSKFQWRNFIGSLFEFPKKSGPSFENIIYKPFTSRQLRYKLNGALSVHSKKTLLMPVYWALLPELQKKTEVLLSKLKFQTQCSTHIFLNSEAEILKYLKTKKNTGGALLVLDENLLQQFKPESEKEFWTLVRHEPRRKHLSVVCWSKSPQDIKHLWGECVIAHTPDTSGAFKKILNTLFAHHSSRWYQASAVHCVKAALTQKKFSKAKILIQDMKKWHIDSPAIRILEAELFRRQGDSKTAHRILSQNCSKDEIFDSRRIIALQRKFKDSFINETK